MVSYHYVSFGVCAAGHYPGPFSTVLRMEKNGDSEITMQEFQKPGKMLIGVFILTKLAWLVIWRIYCYLVVFLVSKIW